MDTAVALVRAYLNVNGYFTVTEYPVVEAMRHGGYRTATDLDVLAIRFPGAGRLVPKPGRSSRHDEFFEPDPVLAGAASGTDMLIGEVKEGPAELNRGAREPEVLRAVLRRFGCCSAEHAARSVDALLASGHAELPQGHRARLVAFGSGRSRAGGGRYEVIELGDVLRFLRGFLEEHWEVLRHAQFKDEALGFLALLAKAHERTSQGEVGP